MDCSGTFSNCVPYKAVCSLYVSVQAFYRATPPPRPNPPKKWWWVPGPFALLKISPPMIDEQ